MQFEQHNDPGDSMPDPHPDGLEDGEWEVGPPEYVEEEVTAKSDLEKRVDLIARTLEHFFLDLAMWGEPPTNEAIEVAAGKALNALRGVD